MRSSPFGRTFACFALLLAGCQVIGGIEVRDPYVPPDMAASGEGGADKPSAGSAGKAANGGSSAGATVVEGGAGGMSTPGGAGVGAYGGAAEGGSGAVEPAVCGDGEQQPGEVCDDGAENGTSTHCDTSCLFVCPDACPLRVDPAIETPGDGSSWDKALASLQAAVTAQQSAGSGEVWVKQGVFTATAAGTLLTLGSSVAIYGGFAGTEQTLSERPAPTEATVTVLDANQLAYPALRGAGGAVLDGFMVKNATGPGGSALTSTAITGLVLRHVWFKDNASTGSSNCGGALVLTGGGEARLEACRFEGNSSEGVGGAICLNGTASTLTIDRTSFVDNQAAASGGALYAFGTYSPSRVPTIHVTASTFIGNATTTHEMTGGALYVSNALLDVTDSDFMSNSAMVAEGAAIFCETDAKCPIVNSTFVKNLGFRAAVSGSSPDLKVVNSTFAFNDEQCPDHCDVSNSTFAALQNSVLVQTDKIHMQSTGGQVMGFNNCSIFTSGGLGSKPSPFVEPLVDTDGNGVPEYLLSQPASNDCLDAGDDAYADAANIAWDMLTTSANNCLDVAPIDAGRHYRPTTANPAMCK